MKTGTLIFFCGKMGAGKSTRAAELARAPRTVLISEDAWLSALYPDQIHSLDAYISRAQRLRAPIKPLVQSVLSAGTNVVMDFPANTVRQRAWFRDIFENAGASHRLEFIDVADEVCLARIALRRTEQPERAATDKVEMFERVTAYFEPPLAEEGFHVVRVLNEPQED